MMVYHITAHTNDRARLIVSETRTTDEAIRDLVAANLKARGFHVLIRTEF